MESDPRFPWEHLHLWTNGFPILPGNGNATNEFQRIYFPIGWQVIQCLPREFINSPRGLGLLYLLASFASSKYLISLTDYRQTSKAIEIIERFDGWNDDDLGTFCFGGV